MNIHKDDVIILIFYLVQGYDPVGSQINVTAGTLEVVLCDFTVRRIVLYNKDLQTC